jgi:hypothetical protein
LLTKALVALGCRVVANPVGVEKEEKTGMAMDSAARAEEKRDETEEMIKEMRLSLVRTVPLEFEKEGLGVIVEELEDSVDEVKGVEEDEDSVNETDEEDDDDEESAEALEVETKELVGSAEELVENAEDEEVLFWTAVEELIRLEDKLEGAWVEETTELLEADEDEEIAAELEEEAAAEELEEIAEEERARDAEDEDRTLELAFEDEGRTLELAFDDEEGL